MRRPCPEGEGSLHVPLPNVKICAEHYCLDPFTLLRHLTAPIAAIRNRLARPVHQHDRNGSLPLIFCAVWKHLAEPALPTTDPLLLGTYFSCLLGLSLERLICLLI